MPTFRSPSSPSLACSPSPAALCPCRRRRRHPRPLLLSPSLCALNLASVVAIAIIAVPPLISPSAVLGSAAVDAGHVQVGMVCRAVQVPSDTSVLQVTMRRSVVCAHGRGERCRVARRDLWPARCRVR